MLNTYFSRYLRAFNIKWGKLSETDKANYFDKNEWSTYINAMLLRMIFNMLVVCHPFEVFKILILVLDKGLFGLNFPCSSVFFMSHLEDEHLFLLDKMFYFIMPCIACVHTSFECKY